MNRNYFEKKHRSVQAKQAAQTVKKALEEDPTVFLYDEVYDEMASERTEKKAQAKADRKPKYIGGLLKNAERRQRENDRRTEKMAQKELEKEADKYSDKEAFVTGAYKRKMEEMQRLEEEERRQDAIDDLTDVSKQQDLGGFYRQLYKSTVNKQEPVEANKSSEPPSSSSSSTSPIKSQEPTSSSTSSSKSREASSSSASPIKSPEASSSSGTPTKTPVPLASSAPLSFAASPSAPSSSAASSIAPTPSIPSLEENPSSVSQHSVYQKRTVGENFLNARALYLERVAQGVVVARVIEKLAQ